jgi:DNA-nicking Smr family endonuclease
MTRRQPAADEVELWRHVMRDAVPLRQGRDRRSPVPTVPPPPAPPVGPAEGTQPDSRLTGQPAADRPEQRLAELLKGDTLPVASRGQVRLDLAPSGLGNRSGIDRRTDERVRRGRLPLDGRIDLHGMTQGEAHAALLSCLRSGYQAGRRLILVITGKGSLTVGGGVLKSAVPRWLHEAPFRSLVLAVHQAQPQHGGAGALYIFLKRRRER